MTLKQIKHLVMFNTNNDIDDISDFLPYLTQFINEGYDRLTIVWDYKHVSSDSEEYPSLSSDGDEPALPEWTHIALADWATWRLYEVGNPQKQQRGLQYRNSFLLVESKIKEQGGKEGEETGGKAPKNFTNIYP